ncbi:transcription antitermination factor NusB [Acidocella sp.]|uniref:transcription antitermination factor NusB n=1 Tax=Acidocella sp. TaxID=50710 RepID=UPI002604624C|nr:transcription antitermination factor NusB [Acidocella sp.]
MTRPRTFSRIAAVQALYQSEHAELSPETVIDQFIRHRISQLPWKGGLEDGNLPETDVPLFTRIVRTATQQQDVIDGMITQALPEAWPMPRLDPVLRAALRAGGAELWMADGPPAKVVINEYLDVTHGFFSGDEPRMLNGVLDKLAHLLRPAEFASTS